MEAGKIEAEGPVGSRAADRSWWVRPVAGRWYAAAVAGLVAVVVAGAGMLHLAGQTASHLPLAWVVLAAAICVSNTVIVVLFSTRWSSRRIAAAVVVPVGLASVLSIFEATPLLEWIVVFVGIGLGAALPLVVVGWPGWSERETSGWPQRFSLLRLMVWTGGLAVMMAAARWTQFDLYVVYRVVTVAGPIVLGWLIGQACGLIRGRSAARWAGLAMGLISLGVVLLAAGAQLGSTLPAYGGGGADFIVARWFGNFVAAPAAALATGLIVHRAGRRDALAAELARAGEGTSEPGNP